MSEGSNTKTMLLTAIALVLVAILGVMLYQMNQKTPAEEAAESVSKAAEDIGDVLRGE